jgi:hypothetical protein
MTQVSSTDDLSRLDGLNPQEMQACLLAERVLHAVARAHDIGGIHGAVDAMLTLQDGRTAAFEVTNVAAEGALQTANLLARDNHRWPLPGQWFWSIEVGSPADLKRLRRCYEKIILICERRGVAYPHQMHATTLVEGQISLQTGLIGCIIESLNH